MELSYRVWSRIFQKLRHTDSVSLVDFQQFFSFTLASQLNFFEKYYFTGNEKGV